MPAPHPYLDWPGPIAFAHRGGASEAPENTIPAFRRAHDLGYRYLETDVHATADGVLVAFHDDDLERTCGRPGRISQLTWDEVSRCRVDGREPIPRMRDLAEEFPDARFNIDCKSPAAVGPLAEFLLDSDLGRVCVGSFSTRRIRAVRRLVGERLCVSCGPAQIVAARWFGWNPLDAHAMQVPVASGRVTITDARAVSRAHRLGMQLHVWTIDDATEMHRLLDLGVDGVMTDRPAVLKEVLTERGDWVDP